MKLKYEFAYREILGEHVMIPLNQGARAVSGMIYTNEVGAFLMGLLQKDCSFTELISCLLEEFDVSERDAYRDLAAFLDKMKENNLLIE